MKPSTKSKILALVTNFLIEHKAVIAMTYWFSAWFAAEKSATRSCCAVAEGNRQFPVHEQLLLLLLMLSAAVQKPLNKYLKVFVLSLLKPAAL